MNQDKLRIDKNIAYNVLDFQKYEDKQTQIIIKSLLIYFSYSYQSDLFGYGTLDPHLFARKMNIDKDTLFKTHPNPKQIADSPLSKEELMELQENNGRFSTHRLWDSYLENALYILSTVPLFEEYKGSTESHDFVGMHNFIIVRDRRLVTERVNRGRVQKVLYKYQLDDVFERNLRRFFLQTNFDNYLLCKSKGVEDIYLFVSNIYQTYKKKGINKYHWKLEDLLVYFDISNSLEPKHQKQKLNKQLQKLEKVLAKEIQGFKFGWDKGDGQRWAYVPFATWDKVDNEKEKEADYKALDSVLYKHIKRDLYEIYLNQKDDGKEYDNFFSWLQSDEDIEIKKSAYIRTYSLNKKLPSFPKPETLANSFFKKIKEAANQREVEKCFEP